MIQLMIGFVVAVLMIPIIYVQGLWFMFTKPSQFLKFMKLYKAHAKSIETKELIQESGFFDMRRSDRRKVLQKARNEADRRIRGNA